MLPEQFSMHLFPDDPVVIEWEPTDDEIACAVELNTLSIFRTQFRHLRTRFHSFRAMLEAPPEKLDSFPDGTEFLKQRYIEQRAGIAVGTERAKIPSDVNVITYFDHRYPLQLRGVYNPPPVLYVKGEISFDYNMSIAIVGSRSFTDYGRRRRRCFISARELGIHDCFRRRQGNRLGCASLRHERSRQNNLRARVGPGYDFSGGKQAIIRGNTEVGRDRNRISHGHDSGQVQFPDAESDYRGVI